MIIQGMQAGEPVIIYYYDHYHVAATFGMQGYLQELVYWPQKYKLTGGVVMVVT